MNFSRFSGEVEVGKSLHPSCKSYLIYSATVQEGQGYLDGMDGSRVVDIW